MRSIGFSNIFGFHIPNEEQSSTSYEINKRRDFKAIPHSKELSFVFI